MKRSPASDAAYWNNLAPTYDSLYASIWSRWEDEETKAWLIREVAPNAGVILDLACGTGLGYGLLRPSDQDIGYVGIDISTEMLSQFSKLHPSADCRVGSIDDLSIFQVGEFDRIICLNAAFSFSQDQRQALAEMHRILAKGDVIFISVLNRSSLRRLVRLKFSRNEDFVTRGADAAGGFVTATTFTLKEAKQLLKSSGFSVVDCFHQGVLAGVAEYSALISTERIVRQAVPFLSHTLNIVAKRS